LTDLSAPPVSGWSTTRFGVNRASRWVYAQLGTGLQAAIRPSVSIFRGVYEASLRLALGRREREHRLDHIALALVALDPGVSWLLHRVDVDARAVLDDLTAAFPPPRYSRPAGIQRRFSRRRMVAIGRRYERTTGRIPTAVDVLAEVMAS
jgi:hypothetical protein